MCSGSDNIVVCYLVGEGEREFHRQNTPSTLTPFISLFSLLSNNGVVRYLLVS